MSAPLAKTPLDAIHRAAGARMVSFAGYDMPISYTSIVAEHQACRQRAALFDVSHMGRLRFDGEGSEELLDKLLTRKVSDMPLGAVRYSLICDHKGGVLDDVLVSHLETPSQQRYHLMVVNASNRMKLRTWVEQLLPEFPRVTLSDRTDITAMIAVQGPLAIEVAKRLFRFDPSRLRYYQAAITDQFSKPVLVSRTGYTGEDGFELVCRAEDATRIWENLMLVGREAGFTAAGLGARDTLRLEAGMPLYGHELTEEIDPLTAGLGFACTLDGREFIGEQVLTHRSSSPHEMVRVGLLPQTKRPAREGYLIYNAAGERVGHVTSGSQSPTFNHPIAMGYIRREDKERGNLQIEIRGTRVPTEIVQLPFYRRTNQSSGVK
ncbi:MAG: glycine cleavage system aminomethyltransferase GcvT [Rubripirellula sp.]|nr:glycine cleavage system aminomethyltransferase GcvT [Rubripirellula sp.]